MLLPQCLQSSGVTGVPPCAANKVDFVIFEGSDGTSTGAVGIKNEKQLSVWWLIPAIPAVGRLKASLHYTASLKPNCAT